MPKTAQVLQKNKRSIKLWAKIWMTVFTTIKNDTRRSAKRWKRHHYQNTFEIQENERSDSCPIYLSNAIGTAVLFLPVITSFCTQLCCYLSASVKEHIMLLLKSFRYVSSSL